MTSTHAPNAVALSKMPELPLALPRPCGTIAHAPILTAPIEFVCLDANRCPCRRTQHPPRLPCSGIKAMRTAVDNLVVYRAPCCVLPCAFRGISRVFGEVHSLVHGSSLVRSSNGSIGQHKRAKAEETSPQRYSYDTRHTKRIQRSRITKLNTQQPSSYLLAARCANWRLCSHAFVLICCFLFLPARAPCRLYNQLSTNTTTTTPAPCGPSCVIALTRYRRTTPPTTTPFGVVRKLLHFARIHGHGERARVSASTKT